jgi:hypothetical protein
MTPSQTLIEGLKKRMLPDGGFAFFNGGSYRTDATAWAIIGLRSAGEGENLIEPGLNRLAGDQMRDGRVVTSPDAPDAFWVTPLAVLAWHGSERHKENMNRAVEFLLSTSGKHWKKQKLDPVAHDTSIRGWSWTAGVHSWVAPTSYSLLALRAVGKIRHPRAEEAARMLMNRQLAAGGWNYGNTSVYGRQLYPQPDQTGVALSALSPYVTKGEVIRSLEYLGREIGRIRTPLSLGLGLLGLGAWGDRPPGFMNWVRECVDRQNRRGIYNTQERSLLLLAISGNPALIEETAKG